MDNIFIGWSGNQSLAIELGEQINKGKMYKAIVGGGTPDKTFIGEQVLGQIKNSDYAILLMEKKNGEISTNLMFEFGYILAKMRVNRIFLVLINMESSELPSDILGTWIFKQKKFDRNKKGESDFANELYNDFLEFERQRMLVNQSNYFGYIDRWEECFTDLKNDNRISTNDSEYIIFGCLAAYYYNDYQKLRTFLDDVICDDEVADLVHFAKVYISIFLDSGNMMSPLNDDQIYACHDAFDMLLKRERTLTSKLDAILDILIHDAYGLSSMLYLRNDTLDEDEREEYNKCCEEHLLKVFELLENYQKTFKDNEYIINLFNAYICNDLAKFYRNDPEQAENHIKYLNRSVEERHKLFNSVQKFYSGNKFLVEKMEQEYHIALSDQCKYLENTSVKKRNIKQIKARLAKWSSDHESLRSMIARIETNLNSIDNL